MFIDSNQTRINIYAPFTSADGIRYPDLRDEALRAQLGITEIADPVAPEDFSDELYFRTEQDTAPYIVYTKKPDEMIAATQAAKATTEALAYLASTDWYVTRKAETGKDIPEDVLAQRETARTAVTKPQAPTDQVTDAPVTTKKSKK